MRLYIFAIFSALMLCCGTAYADGEVLSVNGITEPWSCVSADIYYRGKGPDDLMTAAKDDYLNIIAYHGETRSDADGFYEIPFLPKSDSEKYTVFLRTNDGIATQWFPFDEAETASCLSNAASAAEVGSILKENSAVFTALSSVCDDGFDSVAEIMYNSLSKKSVNTLFAARELLDECIFLNEYSKNPDSVSEECLKKLKFKNIPFDTLISRPYITDEIRAEAMSALSDSSLGKSACAFEEALGRAFVLSVVKERVGIANMKEVLDSFCGEIGFEPRLMSARNYLKIYGREFSSYDELKEEFFKDSFLYILKGAKQAAVCSVGSGDTLTLAVDIQKDKESDQSGVLIYAVYKNSKMLTSGMMPVTAAKGAGRVTAALPFTLDADGEITVKGFFIKDTDSLKPYTDAVSLTAR